MDETEVDYLVIGSGIAGLWFAWKAGQKGRVLIVTKKNSAESNTNYAQGGIAAAVADDDNPRLHYEDTIRAGAGLTHPDIAQLVTDAGPRLIRELWSLGVKFSLLTDSKGQPPVFGPRSSVSFSTSTSTSTLSFLPPLDLGKEGGHRRRRIVHARDATGFEIEQALLRAVRSLLNVKIWEEHFTIDLLLTDNGAFYAALVLQNPTGKLKLIRAKACLLATGGIGQLYPHTTNPLIATGDGIAMAFRAGAQVANMEFIQFHPTSLFGQRIDDRAFLISEAVRGEGALLKTTDGKEFMNAYHPDGSLAPRDVVARAIAAQISRRNDQYVLLDCTSIPHERLRRRFPNIYETCLRFGIDITREPIPVVPAAHYVCGGVVVNSWGETTIPRLFAAGECACTGLHGANRLASNSLLEALVFAERAAINATASYYNINKNKTPLLPSLSNPQSKSKGEEQVVNIKSRLRNIMWSYAGIVRSDEGLLQGGDQLKALLGEAEAIGRVNSVPILEIRNMLLVAQLIVSCARRRLESRGLHYNQDHPLPDERFEHDTVISKAELEPIT